MISRYNVATINLREGIMNVEEIIKKAEANEGLTVEEVKIYQQAVKPKKHV